MSHYFDKSFFKFFVGFAAIVGLSFLVIVGARLYEAQSVQTAAVTSVNP